MLSTFGISCIGESNPRVPATIHGSDHLTLVALLRDVRRKANLRQSDVAARLGVPQSFVSKYETGERRLDLVELRRVCAALGTPLIDVVRRFERGVK